MAEKKMAKLMMNAVTRTGRKVLIEATCVVTARDDLPFGFEGPLTLREISSFMVLPEEEPKKTRIKKESV